ATDKNFELFNHPRLFLTCDILPHPQGVEELIINGINRTAPIY
ncbi:unnamed protein product, partial [marine sediment metagenome]